MAGKQRFLVFFLENETMLNAIVCDALGCTVKGMVAEFQTVPLYFLPHSASPVRAAYIHAFAGEEASRRRVDGERAESPHHPASTPAPTLAPRVSSELFHVSSNL